MNCGLYKITNVANGKFYIGSSDNMPRRFSQHLLDLRKNRHDNPHLQLAWNRYGFENFLFKPYRECKKDILLEEEQKELTVWVGRNECYNIRKDAKRPVAIGEHRSEEVKKKISDSQKGKPRLYARGNKWSLGRKHSLQTLKKFKNRPSSFENIKAAQTFNDGRIYPPSHGYNISACKRSKNKRFNTTELMKIREGVRKSVKEGRCRKNKVPLNEYKNIKSLYLSGMMNKRKLAFKYEITPSSMAKLLKRIGV